MITMISTISISCYRGYHAYALILILLIWHFTVRNRTARRPDPRAAIYRPRGMHHNPRTKSHVTRNTPSFSKNPGLPPLFSRIVVRASYNDAPRTKHQPPNSLLVACNSCGEFNDSKCRTAIPTEGGKLRGRIGSFCPHVRLGGS